MSEVRFWSNCVVLLKSVSDVQQTHLNLKQPFHYMPVVRYQMSIYFMPVAVTIPDCFSFCLRQLHLSLTAKTFFVNLTKPLRSENNFIESIRKTVKRGGDHFSKLNLAVKKIAKHTGCQVIKLFSAVIYECS